MKKVLLWLTFAVSISLVGCKDVALHQLDDTQAIEQLSTHEFVQYQTLMTKQQQQQASHAYLARHFSPWTYQKPFLTLSQVLTEEQSYIEKSLKNPGYGVNFHPIDKSFIDQLANNMDLTHFPNHNKPAIIVMNTNLRVLPTLWPSFKNPEEAGEGYPFDYFQESYAAANTPVRILQQTQDGAFSLILAPSCIGWVPTQTLAEVSPAFTQQWMQKAKAVIVQDRVTLFSGSKFYQEVRLGTLLPLIRQSHGDIVVGFAVANSSREAIMKEAKLSPQQAQHFPVAFTDQNMSDIAKQLLGQPYAWGGVYGGYDCSLLVQKLYAPFGIWLPRNSTDQLSAKNVISLAGLSRSDKINKILHDAKPWQSLLGKPGHVVIYVGHKNGELYILNSIWGSLTENALGQKGRSIIGRITLMPIDYRAAQQKTDLLDRITMLIPLELDDNYA